MDLPRLREYATRVPGVQTDEVVPDEGDGQEHRGRDETSLTEEAAVDAQSLVAIGADKALDEGAQVERELQSDGLPGVVPPVAFELASWTVIVLPHPHGSPGTQVVVGMVCGMGIDAGVLGQRTLKGCPSTAGPRKRCVPRLLLRLACGTNRYGSRASKASRRRAFSAAVMPAIGGSRLRWVSGSALE